MRLRVGTNLAGDDGLAEGAREGVDHGQEHGHAEEEPEPLNGGDNGHSSHVASDNHKDCTQGAELGCI